MGTEGRSGELSLSALQSRSQLALAGVYGAFLVGVLLIATVGSTPVSDLVLVAAILYVGVLTVPLLVAPRGRLGWASPPVLASMFAFLALAREANTLVMGTASHAVLPYGQADLDRLKAVELGLLTLGFAVYLFAYYATGDFAGTPRLGSRVLQRPLRPGLAVGAPAFALLMAAVALGFVLLDSGSIDNRLASLAGARRDLLGGQHYLLAVLGSGVAACWLWLAARPATVVSPVFWVAFLASVVSSYLLTGGRAATVAVLAVAGLVWALGRRSLPLMRLGAGVVVAVYAVGVLGAGGSNRQELLDYAGSRDFSEVVAEALTGEFSERSTTASGTPPILADVPDSVSYRYGSTYVAALLSPVPRAIWPDKPGLVDSEVGKTFFGTNTGVPAGPVGEAYWNFGLVGVVIIFALFGLFHRWLAWRFMVAAGHPLAVVLYAVFMVNFPVPSSPALVATLQQAVLVIGVFWLLSRPPAGEAIPDTSPARATISQTRGR